MRRDDKVLPLAEFDNTPEGHRKISRWATKGGRLARVCMEATGIYHLELALTLSAHKKIDVMVVKIETVIERLKEYRTALITAAVTGQIDVREAAA